MHIDPPPPQQRPNPYLQKGRHSELQRIIDEGKANMINSTGEQEAGGEEENGEESDEDDLLAGLTPAPVHTPIQPSAKGERLGEERSSHSSVTAPPPSPPASVVAAAAGSDGDDDNSPSGIYDGLAKLAPDTFIDKNRLAKIFGVSEKTIRRRITTGELPPPHMRMNRQPQWHVGELLEWLRSEAKRRADESVAHRRHILGKSE